MKLTLRLKAGVITIAALIVLRETYPPTLLERKASRLRKETGNDKLMSKLDSGLSPKDLFIRSIVRPTKMLFLSPIVLALSTFMAIAYGYLYLLFTTITEVFEGTYGFSQGTVGLTYLGIGVGSIMGLVAFGVSSDLIMKKKSAKGEMKPEYRLPPMIPGAMFIPIGLFWYGWTAEKHVFWLVPIIGTMFVGLGIIATFVRSPPTPSSAVAVLSSKPKLTRLPTDVHLNLPRRRIHPARRLRHGRQHRPAFHRRRRATVGRAEDVRYSWSGLGEFLARLYRVGHVSDSVVLSQVWRAHTNASSVSGEFVDWLDSGHTAALPATSALIGL